MDAVKIACPVQEPVLPLVGVVLERRTAMQDIIADHAFAGSQPVPVYMVVTALKQVEQERGCLPGVGVIPPDPDTPLDWEEQLEATFSSRY